MTLSLLQQRAVPGHTGRPRGSTVAKRVRREGKTGFPFGVIGSHSIKYNSEDLNELKSMVPCKHANSYVILYTETVTKEHNNII